jgi:hypothetical protein
MDVSAARAALSRRPLLKATLRPAVAFDRARQHVRAELRLVARLADATPNEDPTTKPDLRLCS